MKKSPQSLLLLLTLFTGLQAQAGSYTVSECVANHNKWYEDTCTKRKASGTCHATYDNGSQLNITLGGNSLSANVGEAYAIKHGAYARHELFFGGLTRGMLQEDTRHQARLIEVYVNHDSSGDKYTKYTCRQ